MAGVKSAQAQMARVTTTARLPRRFAPRNDSGDRAERSASRRRLSDTLHALLAEWLTRLHAAAYWVQPFLPDAGAKILALLSEDEIRACEPLFPRIK
jgi:hypothetical protein